MHRPVEVPKPDPQKVCKTTTNFEEQKKPLPNDDKASTHSAANNYHPKISVVTEPERQMHPSFNYRIVFDRKNSPQPQLHPSAQESNFPNREKFLEAKCQRLQKELLELKTKRAFGPHRSNLSERVERLVPTRQQRDGKIKLDTMFYSSNSLLTLEYV